MIGAVKTKVTKSKGTPPAKTPKAGAPEPSRKARRGKPAPGAQEVSFEELEAEGPAEEILPPEAPEEGPPELQEELGEAIAEEPAEGRPLPVRRKPAAASEGPAVLDTLSAYMREASKNPILSREEEHELALRWYKDQDQKAAVKLITSNLRLVVKIAWEYRAAHKNLLDLVQEGNVGLLMAVRAFDPYKGVRLSSYAQYWIRAYMLRYIINNFHLVKLGTTQAQRKLFFNLRREKDRLEREGFAPTAKLLAEKLDVKEDEVREMDARLTGGEVSLETPVGQDDGGGSATLSNFIADPGMAADERFAGEEQMARFHKALLEYRKTLDERDGFVFDKRLVAEKPLTLEEVGRRFGVSKERARQVEERIKQNLKKFLDDRGQEFEI